MTLYVADKKRGSYNALSDQAVRKLKRVKEINDLELTVRLVAPTLLALSQWLGRVNDQGNKMTAKDFAVTRLPNRQRLALMATELREKMRAVRK